MLGGREVAVAVVTGLTNPENITHSHITSTCLLCCITGSKEKHPTPKIKGCTANEDKQWESEIQKRPSFYLLSSSSYGSH